ncbi:MAG: tubulin-like doman-containing protein, partial [Treponema sp.]|nr:tubulin-like doman-containing protein [Treponema sp.]
MTEVDALNAIEEKLLAGSRPFELRSDAVAVIIGLGGTGCDFAAQTKQLLLKRYGAALLAEKIKFLCLDTDITNMPKIFTEAEFIPVKGFDRNGWINGW